MDKNQKIKCDVGSCKFNDSNCICSLDEIKVGCQCGCQPKSSEETVCNSYRCDK